MRVRVRVRARVRVKVRLMVRPRRMYLARLLTHIDPLVDAARLRVLEVTQRADLVDVVAPVLDAALRAVADQVLEKRERLGGLGLGLGSGFGLGLGLGLGTGSGSGFGLRLA